MSAKTIAHIVDGLSEPQRTLLLAGDDDEVQAGTGTWFLLRQAGLLDGDFNITTLGLAVRDELRRREVPPPVSGAAKA